MSATIIAKTATALAALDFSTEDERIVELEAGVKDFSQAIEKADARCTEIAQIIRDWKGPDGEAVANALLETDAQSAANQGPDLAALEAERQALRNGIGELNRRLQAASYEVREIKAQAVAAKAGSVTEPLISELMAKAKRAAVEIAEAYAAVAAISDATRAMNAQNAVYSLARATRGLFEMDSLLCNAGLDPIPVPAEILNVLAELDRKGPAVAKGWRRAVVRPS